MRPTLRPFPPSKGSTSKRGQDGPAPRRVLRRRPYFPIEFILLKAFRSSVDFGFGLSTGRLGAGLVFIFSALGFAGLVAVVALLWVAAGLAFETSVTWRGT